MRNFSFLLIKIREGKHLHGSRDDNERETTKMRGIRDGAPLLDTEMSLTETLENSIFTKLCRTRSIVVGSILMTR